MNICVYCSSSDRINSIYRQEAEALGEALATHNHTLVYGGGQVGLMGVLARTVHEAGGQVVGVIPEKLEQKEGIAYGVADEMIVTKTMRERKKVMYTRSDAFIVLPGGYGTLEEFMEVLTLKQLDYHQRPIVLMNTDRFFDPLLAYFERLHAQQFARTPASDLLHVVDASDDALDYIATHMSSTPASDAF